jgi:hypothetical protein
MDTDTLFTRRLSRRDLFVVGLVAAGIPPTIVGGVSLYLLTRPHPLQGFPITHLSLCKPSI